MKKLTLIAITLTLLLGLALWQQRHIVAANTAPIFTTPQATTTADGRTGSSRQAPVVSSSGDTIVLQQQQDTGAANAPSIEGAGLLPPAVVVTSELNSLALPRQQGEAFRVASLAATVTVTTTADSGPGSLRDAIAVASPGDTIAFDATVFSTPQTITLTSGQLRIDKSLTISGPGANLLNVQRSAAAPNFRIFFIGTLGLNVSISGMTISNGNLDNEPSGLRSGAGISSISNLTLTDCAIINNKVAGATTPYGGGISLFQASGTFTRCTFSGNKSISSGGAIYFQPNGGDTLQLNTCTFSGNTSTFNGIVAAEGAAVAHVSSAGSNLLQVTNCTIVGNTTAPLVGGAIATRAAEQGAGNIATTTVGNTILDNWTNTQVNNFFKSAIPGAVAVVTSLGYNLTNEVQAACSSTQPVLNLPTDIESYEMFLGPLQDNGGPTPTIALVAGSPALDKGFRFGATTDQRGFTRPVDLPDIAAASGGDHTDIGAFEAQSVSFAPPILVTNADDAGAGSLRQALLDANANVGLDTIEFDAAFFSAPRTINLASPLPNIAESLTINGPGAHLLTVRRDTGGNYRIFTMPNLGVNVSLSGMTISNGFSNPDSGSGTFGGGIYSASNLTLTDCAIVGNQTATGGAGGGVHLASADGNFTGCTFSGNTADQTGGAIIFNGNGRTLRLTNCTISGNRAKTTTNGGGGITVSNPSCFATLEVVNCTITDNISDGPGGGGIETAASAGATATTVIQNSIIANNTAPNLQIRASSPGTKTVTSLGNNLTNDNGSGFLTGPGDLINTNPLLALLAHYGGTTPTHALLPGSPAINAGNNTGAPATDQRGIARPQGASVDIGAVEAQAFTLAITGGNNQSTAVNTAFPTALQVNLKEGAHNLHGALITFTGPGSGASLNPVSGTATTDANGNASRNVTANSIVGGPYTVMATTGGLSQAFSLTNLCPTITINPTSLPNATVNASYPTTITAAPVGGNYSFAITSGLLPTGLTLNSNGSFSGAPTQGGTFNFRITATGFGLCSDFRDYTLVVVCPTITLSPASLPNATVNTSYPATITAAPAGGNYSFAVTSGLLPVGLTLNSNGSFSGAPMQSGTFNFRITATGFGSCSDFRDYTLVVVCPTITLSPASLPNATINTSYPATITAAPAGGNYSFVVTSGLLPVGLTLNSNGSFSGAPTQSGVFNFRVTATGFGLCSDFRDYTLVVVCPTSTVNPASLPGGTVGTAYNQTVSASPAGTYSYSVSSGALPTGLTLNGSTGALTGTPATSGTFSFTITAAAGACVGARSYTVVIACPALSFTTTSPLPTGQAGVAYSQTLNVTPAGIYTFSLTAGNLPSGLTLNPSTGLISGTGTVAGTYTFTVKAQAANGCSATQAYTLPINCPTVVVNPATLPNGTQGTAYTSQTLTATPAGGNYSFTASGSLPPGLNLNTSTGVLSGTPSGNGSFTFTITATGWGGCTGNRTYTLTIGSGGCPTITLPASLPNGQVGQLYSQSVAASPAGSYTYTLTGAVPPGMTFYAAAALLFGYPTAPGSYSFTIKATNSSNCMGEQSYTVTINGAAARAVAGDFDGDGKTDAAIWRASQANWLVVQSGNNALQTQAWGAPGDKAVAGDYDGDGKVDMAVFSTSGYWRIKRSSDGALINQLWGLSTDVPVAGDYDGDKQTDIAVWRGSSGAWYIVNSATGQVRVEQWGLAAEPYNDVAAPGDYDGDGKTDLAVYRRVDGTWYIRRSVDGAVVTRQWGLGTDTPVPGDYDGDGQTDIAVWRGENSGWYIIHSSTSAVQTVSWGASYAPYNDVAVPGDYDGDGKTDIAVWRPGVGTWYSLNSRDGSVRIRQHGQIGDLPIMSRLY